MRPQSSRGAATFVMAEDGVALPTDRLHARAGSLPREPSTPSAERLARCGEGCTPCAGTHPSGGALHAFGGASPVFRWNRRHNLGLTFQDWGGAILRWPDDKADDKGLTVWHVAAPTSKWFSPSESSFMINYRVDNLTEMLEQLRAGGVEVIQGPDSDDNGLFAWIMDPDGNKVELWEPKLAEGKSEGS
jgi:predicted enzyme related to lactoylglutathione lyase